MSTKRALRGVLTAAALLAAACAAEPPKTPPPEIGPDGLPVIDNKTPLPDPLPVVAARVNGEEIQTRNVAIVAETKLRRKETTDRILAYRRALQEAIARELLLQEALARGIKPDEAKLQQVYDEARAGYRDDASWAEFLAQEGLDDDLFRKELRVQHTVNALIDEVAGHDPVRLDDQAARDFYDENPQLFETGDRLRVRHVLMRVAPDASQAEAQAAFARAQAAHRRLVAGEDFAAVARDVSEDAGTAQNGGELPAFVRAEVPPEFAAVVFDLEVGKLSDVFRTPAGFHVAEVMERLPGERRAFNDVREGLKRQLAARQKQKHVQDFVNELRGKARIDTFI